MNLSKSIAIFSFGALVPFTTMAQTQVTPWLTVGADANFELSTTKASDYEASLKSNANLRFEVLMREGIKAVIKARIEQTLVENGKSKDWESEKIEKVLEEAYITIETDKVSGLPRAILTVGKHEMAFGQAFSELPVFRDSLLYSLNGEREMLGLTVTLPAQTLKFVDSLAISLYENGSGDFKVADEKGLALKVSKTLSQRIKAQASLLVKENAGLADKEKRGSLGFVYEDANGNYKVWAEGLVFDHNPLMTQTDFGGQLGGSYKLGKGTVVVEYQFLQKYAHDLTVAYNLPVNSWLVISPEVKHRKYSDSSLGSNTTVGINARLQLDKINLKKLKTK